MPTILAIESSCDETSASIIHDGKVLNNIVAAQSVHAQYGGVVPELASRAHQQHLVPVVHSALKDVELNLKDLDAVAVTQGPGLLGALLVGHSFAKGLALSLDLPFIAINHMEAHVLAHFIEEPQPPLPFLCLTVSGGHTQLLRVNSPSEMIVLGKTLDDAVGEAFDKAAKMMGLPYPGGPEIDRLARLGRAKYSFPPAQIPGLDFSFSGIKTAILYFLRDRLKEDDGWLEKNKEDLAASVQEALVDMLMEKTSKAMEQEGLQHLALAGGVAANSGLRSRVESQGQEKDWQVYIPAFEYCTDNAAMVAMAAHYKYQAGAFESLEAGPEPRMQING